MTLDEICEIVRQLSIEHGWDQADPMPRMLHVTSEVGKVADAVISLQATAEDQTGAARLALGHEIFDTIWNLCALANATGHRLGALNVYWGEPAFEVLRRYSQHHNIKLRDVAQRLATTGQLPASG